MVLSVSLPSLKQVEKSVSSIPTSRATTIDGVWAACPCFSAPVLLGKNPCFPQEVQTYLQAWTRGGRLPLFFVCPAPFLLGTTRVIPRRYKCISRRGKEGTNDESWAACPCFGGPPAPVLFVFSWLVCNSREAL